MVDTLVETEQRWAPDSPQASLITAVFVGEDWRSYVNFILESRGDQQHRQNVLNAIINLYFVSQAEEVEDVQLPLLKQALDAITNHGGYDEIGRTVMQLLPFDVPADTDFAHEARGLLAHISRTASPYVPHPQVARDGGAHTQLERATARVAKDISYGELEPTLAVPLVEKFAPTDHRVIKLRIAALRHHLSASPRAPLRPLSSNFLPQVLLSIDGSYEAWCNDGHGPAADDPVHALIKRLLHARDHDFTSMRLILESVDDPDATYERITTILSELLAAEPVTETPADRPPKKVAKKATKAAVRIAGTAPPSGRGRADTKPEAVLWPPLPEIIENLTLNQAVEALLVQQSAAEPVVVAMLYHLQLSGQAEFNDYIIRGVRIMQRLVLDYHTYLSAAHRADVAYQAARLVADRVWGMQQAAERLPSVLNGLPSPDKYSAAFRRLCLNMLVYSAAISGKSLHSIVKALERRAHAPGRL